MLLSLFLAAALALRGPRKNLRAVTDLAAGDGLSQEDESVSILEEIKRAQIDDEDDTDNEGGKGAGVGEKKRFMAEMVKFRDELLSDGEEWQANLLASIKDHEPERTPSLQVKWQPVDCAAAGYQLEKVKRVYGKSQKNQVLKMRDRKSKKFYALKLYGRATDFSTELSFFTVADLPYILKPVCVVRDLKIPMRPGIVFEWIESGDSLAYAKNPTTTPEDLLRMSAQLLVALEYVHWLGYAHADLKPENVMVDGEGNIKLIDFGYALPISYLHPHRGNMYILAPEMAGLVKGQLSEAIDWYAYASTLAAWYAFKFIPDYRYGILDDFKRGGHKRTDTEMYDQRREVRFYLTSINKRGTKFHFSIPPVDFPLELRQLLYLLTDPDPTKRQFTSEGEIKLLRSLPFFADISWKHVPQFK